MTSSVVVVTGATGTLGQELVSQLSGEGFKVLAVSRSGASVNRGEHAAISLDLSRDSSAETLKSVIGDTPVSFVVHAVGLPAAPDVTSVEPSRLASAVDIKAGGFLRLVRAVEGNLAQGARLVAVGGHLGVEPTEFTPLAGVANAALASLVRQLVGPIGRRGATVHLVAPGPFASPRVDAMISRQAAATGQPVDQVRADFLAEYPMGVMPSAGDVAAVIAGLREPSAACLHGSTLFADGGVKRSIF